MDTRQGPGRTLEIKQRLGDHVSPHGLYERLKSLPFAGRLTANADALEAGAWHEIVLDYEVGSSGVADGATFKLTFKFYSDWALFQTADPAAANFVSAEYQAGPLMPGQSPASVQSLSVRFDQKGHERPFQKAVIVDIVDGYLNAGDHIIVRLGDRRGGGPGTRVQTFAEDNFRFRAYIDPLGTSRFVAVAGDVTLRIKPGVAASLALAGPRAARPGCGVAFHLAAFDRWGNAALGLGGVAGIDVFAGDRLAARLTIAFPTEGWACARVEGLVCDDVPLRLIARYGTLIAEALVTPIPELSVPRILYGDLHVHAHDTVGTNSPACNAAFARDVAGIDVYGYTANDFQITDRNWADGVAVVEQFNHAGSFVAFPVQEWCGSSAAGGDHKVIFLGDGRPGFPYDAAGNHNRTLTWNEDMKGAAAELGRWPVEELWDAYLADPENHLIIPHVGGRRYIPDWHHPGLERLVEIASAWGHFGWLYQDVIARGYRLGVCANGDEHRGRPGGGFPGVQVFGVRGGLTGILAGDLNRASVGRALRARHTFATTGERTAILVHAGDYIQGDSFHHQGPLTIHYRFLGEAGWDEIAAFDHSGAIWRRNLQEELGFSRRRVRLRWGGARIRDRYRWAAWEGRLSVLGTNILSFAANGFEHCEETAWRSGPTDVAFRSETYGDSDALELELGSLPDARFIIEGTIGGFVKAGDPRKPAPFVHVPGFRWEVSGTELLATGSVRRDLGGAELFLALERLTDETLPTEISGSFAVEPFNAPFGFRPVYLFGRQCDDAKVWSSAQFITFADGDI